MCHIPAVPLVRIKVHIPREGSNTVSQDRKDTSSEVRTLPSELLFNDYSRTLMGSLLAEISSRASHRNHILLL